MRLSRNKILVTGGNKGIGLALVKKFLELKNEVIVTGRNGLDLNLVKEQYPEVTLFKADLSKADEVEKLAKFIRDKHPDLNILVNNAGVQYNYDFPNEVDLISKIQEETEVNFMAPLHLAASLLPVLELNDNSAIVNVSSALAIVPKKQAPVYCATKAGIHIFSKALRYQLSKTKVFEIIPSLVDTAMTSGRGKGKISPEELVDEFIRSFKRNKYEINIGKVKMLRILNRLAPSMADRLMQKSN